MYWKKNVDSKLYKPNTEKCGFIWFAGSVPNDSQIISNFKSQVNSILANYNIDPIVVIDGVLTHESYFMISLIFDLQNEKEELNIKEAFEDLKKVSAELGVTNYKTITPFK